MDLVKELHAKDRVEVVQRHNGEIELYIPCPKRSCTTCTMSPMGLAGEFTAFMVPLSLVILRPRHLASSFEMKLWVTPESNSAQAACELLGSFFAPNPYGCGLCPFGLLPYFYLG